MCCRQGPGGLGSVHLGAHFAKVEASSGLCAVLLRLPGSHDELGCRLLLPRVGKASQYVRKGRRVAEEYPHLLSELTGLREETAACGEERLGLFCPLAGYPRRDQKKTCLLWRRELAWMDRLPNLLCSLGQVCVRERCLQQREATALEGHQGLTTQFAVCAGCGLPACEDKRQGIVDGIAQQGHCPLGAVRRQSLQLIAE